MLNPGGDLVPAPSSPTNSSVSSSDLDTESTGSFFHDRSTSLGTLMGVSFPTIAFRAPSQPNSAAASFATIPIRDPDPTSKKTKKPQARWWRFCRDGFAKPASLADFLEVERRIGDGAFYGTTAELESMVINSHTSHGRRLFADGRVLPPPVVDDAASTAGTLCSRFPVLLTGICSGGAG
ncbi:hypothetical protein HN51_037913 [Arachis hypogaea]|uniref:Uncharacterized protein n=2 Tax=Arachis TaxID=3817 RepID=A0A444ZU64_ARAHY|nr:uncharacterized protein At3g17950 [Arachis duranensis]XP_016193669.1 uncharacterized protein At3g17950 [Arachis ipaensis]XP_025639304.1 uncharacterized protein At3g17950 [Arachis hypogaea]XP_025690979.1 uncharacterized protein At3g17950 [Arachis hypogaea]QHO03536.1 uncharacterized protein DS421_13g433020 [Arachis hypogaea]QHO59739.1 uncharacterized protein DS421_3g101510 [Arachis hypogaea]RYR17686.1 hypothetical protein Ahy_B03g062383 [Arachis hypogaea]